MESPRQKSEANISLQFSLGMVLIGQGEPNMATSFYVFQNFYSFVVVVVVAVVVVAAAAFVLTFLLDSITD